MILLRCISLRFCPRFLADVAVLAAFMVTEELFFVALPFPWPALEPSVKGGKKQPLITSKISVNFRLFQ